MSDKITIKLEGIAELEKQLLKMGQEMGAEALMSSAYTATKDLEDAMRTQIAANGSIETGLLYASIARKKVVAGKHTLMVITGVDKRIVGRDKFGNPRRPSKYAHLVNAKKPFVEPAFAARREVVVKKFIDSVKLKLARFNRDNA